MGRMATTHPCATGSARRRSPSAASGWAIPVGLLLAAASALAADDGPATTTRSVTISLPPTTRPADVHTLGDRIVPTDVEKTVLDAVRDRTFQFDETGLYVMLALAGRAPEIGPMQWYELDRPAYANLLAHPARYRGTALRAKVRVHYVSRMQSGVKLGFRSFWPKDRPVWEMDCIWTDEPHKNNKPVRVYSVVDPTLLIGPPDEVGPQSRGKYDPGHDLRIAAMFYKITLARQASDRSVRAYPVMMAWQLSRTAPLKSLGQWNADGPSQWALPLVLVILLAVAFYFTRRRVTRLKQADRDAFTRYRPVDSQAHEKAPGAADAQAQDEDKLDAPDGPVDPELTAAVEQFLQDRQPDDGPR